MGTGVESGVSAGNRWRVAIWGTAAVLLLIPAVASLLTDEVRWGPGDFGTFGAMLLGACGAYEAFARASASRAYRAGAAIAIVTAFLLVWVNLAVGFLGDEGNPANLMFAGVLAIGIGAGAIGRFRPRGMMRAMVATAAAQVLAGAIAAIRGWGFVLPPTAVFVALWLVAAALFRTAARERT